MKTMEDLTEWVLGNRDCWIVTAELDGEKNDCGTTEGMALRDAMERFNEKLKQGRTVRFKGKFSGIGASMAPLKNQVIIQ